MKRITTSILKEKKNKKEKITMLTAYDFPMARFVDEAGIDMILVGDSLGNVVLGYDTTIPVTMDDMIHHTKAVARVAKHAMVVGDMPFLSCNVSVEVTLRNAGRFLQEAGAQAVKLEGGKNRVAAIEALVDAGIPVIGHLGLTPQSVHQFGGFKVQGRDEVAAQELIRDALALEKAGICALVLECVPAPLATLVTEILSVPTIGIGAGAGCDGQVLVVQDLLGVFGKSVAKFVKQYANLDEIIAGAIASYKKEVEEGVFPGADHIYKMDEELLLRLREFAKSR